MQANNEQRERLMLYYNGGTEKQDEKKLKSGIELLKKRTVERQQAINQEINEKKDYVQKKLFAENTELTHALAQLSKAQEQFDRHSTELLEHAVQECKPQAVERSLKVKAVNLKTYISSKKRKKILFSFCFTCLLIATYLISRLDKITYFPSNEFKEKFSGDYIINPFSRSYQQWLDCELFPKLPYNYDDLKFKDCESTTVKAANDSNILDYYLYSITNSEDIILNGALPKVETLGPYRFKLGIKRSNVDFTSELDRVSMEERTFYDYIGDASLLDLNVTNINYGFLRFKAKMEALGGDEAILKAMLSYHSFREVVQTQLVPYAEMLVDGSRVLTSAQLDELGANNITLDTVSAELLGYVWLLVDDCDELSLSFRCFVDTYKFTRLRSHFNLTNEVLLDAFIQDNAERLPVFGNEPFTLQQAVALFRVLYSDAAADCAYASDEECAFQAFDGIVSTAGVNLVFLLDLFEAMWREEGAQPIIYSDTKKRLSNGKNSGDLLLFYTMLETHQARCLAQTATVGALKCTQLNDVIQYNHMLFQRELTLLYPAVQPAVGLMVTKSAREVLLTGFPDGIAALLSIGHNLPGHGDLTNATIKGVWQAEAWVKPVLPYPSRAQLEALEATAAARGDATVRAASAFPASFEPRQSSPSDDVDDDTRLFPLQVRYTGRDDLRRMLALNAFGGQAFSELFGEASFFTGFDQYQVAPSFDFLHEGFMFATDGTVERDALNLWPRQYDVFEPHSMRSHVFEELFYGLFCPSQQLLQPVFYSNYSAGTQVDPSLSLAEIELHLETVNAQVATGIAAVEDARDELDADAVAFRRFRLQDGYLTKLATDRADKMLANCLIDVSVLHEAVPVYLGSPRYHGCFTRDGLVSDTAFQSEKWEEDDDRSLPLEERAEFTGAWLPLDPDSDVTFMDVEPVSGMSLRSQRSLGSYVFLRPDRLHPAVLPAVVPVWASYYAHRLPDTDVEQLIDTLDSVALQVSYLKLLYLLIILGLVTVPSCILYMMYRASTREAAYVAPLEDLKHTIRLRHRELMQPHSDKLAEAKAKVDAAQSKLEERQQQIDGRQARREEQRKARELEQQKARELMLVGTEEDENQK